MAASGGYWLACAADEVIADPSSIVGSIGVISAGFGFQDLIARIGVERRVHTSGENKSMLDPFRPEQPEDVERLKRLQAEIHEGFKAWVRERRGRLLKADESLLFTGEFWTARRGLEYGWSTDSASCARPCSNDTARRCACPSSVRAAAFCRASACKAGPAASTLSDRPRSRPSTSGRSGSVLDSRRDLR